MPLIIGLLIPLLGTMLGAATKTDNYTKKVMSVPHKMGTDILLILFFISYTPRSAQSPLSRLRYPMASAIWWLCTLSEPSRSAIVLATFKIRL